jgi:hypothetical protein
MRQKVFQAVFIDISNTSKEGSCRYVEVLDSYFEKAKATRSNYHVKIEDNVI